MDSSGATSVSIVFDDGPTITVDIKPRDIARLEELDRSFAEDGLATPRRMVLAAWLALQRMARRGELPEDVSLPTSLDDFLDVADVESVDSGKDTPPSTAAASTGE